MFDSEDSSSDEVQAGDVSNQDDDGHAEGDAKDDILHEDPVQAQTAKHETRGRGQIVSNTIANAILGEAHEEGASGQLARDAKEAKTDFKEANLQVSNMRVNSELALREHEADHPLRHHCPETLLNRATLDTATDTHQHSSLPVPHLFKAIRETTAIARRITNNDAQRAQQKQQLEKLLAAYAHSEFQLFQHRSRAVDRFPEHIQPHLNAAQALGIERRGRG